MKYYSTEEGETLEVYADGLNEGDQASPDGTHILFLEHKKWQVVVTEGLITKIKQMLDTMQNYKVVKHFGGNKVETFCHKVGKYYYPVNQFNERGLLKIGAKPIQATKGNHLLIEKL